MQAHLVCTILIVPGMVSVAAALDLRVPTSAAGKVAAATTALVALQAGINYSVSDQSSNDFFERCAMHVSVVGSVCIYMR